MFYTIVWIKRVWQGSKSQTNYKLKLREQLIVQTSIWWKWSTSVQKCNVTEPEWFLALFFPRRRVMYHCIKNQRIQHMCTRTLHAWLYNEQWYSLPLVPLHTVSWMSKLYTWASMALGSSIPASLADKPSVVATDEGTLRVSVTLAPV